eukprot:TRINITY_DN26906_c0_g1_i1.p2 TRINITY_DN26906_c0_g1~~TRINITY_DN26906_c0_g1_i1.p2  ORF type:complete len:159 (-),score=54.53 TRINITY_DN26906_c0_g1_i1:35-511(-)
MLRSLVGSEMCIRDSTNAVTSSVVGLDGTPAAGIGAWEAAVTCAHIFPSIGAMGLTEVFELVLQSGSLWDTPFVVSAGYKGTVGAAHGGSDMQRAVTHRLSSLASIIEVSVGYVDPKLACRFASQFCFNTCLLYTSDAADEEDSVDLVGCTHIKKKKS